MLDFNLSMIHIMINVKPIQAYQLQVRHDAPYLEAPFMVTNSRCA